MTTAKEPCPLCRAAPADWVDDPHPPELATRDRLHRATQIIAAMCSLTDDPLSPTVHGKTLSDWRHLGRLWLLNEGPA